MDVERQKYIEGSKCTCFHCQLAGKQMNSTKEEEELKEIKEIIYSGKQDFYPCCKTITARELREYGIDISKYIEDQKFIEISKIKLELRKVYIDRDNKFRLAIINHYNIEDFV